MMICHSGVFADEFDEKMFEIVTATTFSRFNARLD